MVEEKRTVGAAKYEFVINSLRVSEANEVSIGSLMWAVSTTFKQL